jgi:hypothetical protein
MAHGKSKGKMFPVFTDRIKALEESAKEAAESFKSGYTTYKKWAVPKDTVNLLHVPSMHMPNWDRFEVNQHYSETVLGQPGEASGTVADLVAVKVQNDFMAVEERAFRLRHASIARCNALAHGRLEEQGDKQESVFEYLKLTLENIIKAGQVS